MDELRAAGIDAFGLTDKGKKRTENQDHFIIATIHRTLTLRQSNLPGGESVGSTGLRALLLGVADGVGGALAGDEASELALRTILACASETVRCFYRLGAIEADLLRESEAAVQRSGEIVHSRAEQQPSHHGMASTLTMAAVLWPRAYVANVGDSRCYRLRGDRLVQVTRDQTVAQELVDRGVMTPEAAERSRLSHVLSGAIGGESLDPKILAVDLERNDTLLLCSDGLTDELSDETIAELLLTSSSARRACKSLVRAALKSGGSDNVTVVVSRFR